MRIEGRKVLITGGASGIGLATAEALAARGAHLLIAGRREEALAAAAARLRESGAVVATVAADVTTEAGRTALIASAGDRLGGLDVLVNNAGGVRAGRLEDVTEREIRAMVEVNLVGPLLLTRLALPLLRESGDAMVVNVSSGIALIGAPFYATYAAVKAGIARFGEAMRRELKGEGVHVLTVYPAATDTPMMGSSRAGPELGFSREAAAEVGAAIAAGIEADSFEVVRGGETRARMIAANRDDPAAVDARFLQLKPALAEAVRDHTAL